MMNPQQPEFNNINDIVNNFDDFCDSFESRAAEAFLRGDQNNGRVTGKTAEIGTGTPDAVREVQHLDQRISMLERPSLMYRRPSGGEHESLSNTLDYLHNNVEGLKRDLAATARSV